LVIGWVFSFLLLPFFALLLSFTTPSMCLDSSLKSQPSIGNIPLSLSVHALGFSFYQFFWVFPPS
jgi:hypothetical protein